MISPPNKEQLFKETYLRWGENYSIPHKFDRIYLASCKLSHDATLGLINTRDIIGYGFKILDRIIDLKDKMKKGKAGEEEYEAANIEMQKYFAIAIKVAQRRPIEIEENVTMASENREFAYTEDQDLLNKELNPILGGKKVIEIFDEDIFIDDDQSVC